MKIWIDEDSTWESAGGGKKFTSKIAIISKPYTVSPIQCDISYSSGSYFNTQPSNQLNAYNSTCTTEYGMYNVSLGELTKYPLPHQSKVPSYKDFGGTAEESWRWYSECNDQGKRVCKQCPKGYVFDPNQDGCVLMNTAKQCQDGYMFDQIQNKCVLWGNAIPIVGCTTAFADCPWLTEGYDVPVYLPHDTSCNGYCTCGTYGSVYESKCPEGYYFNPELQRCDLPKNVEEFYYHSGWSCE